MKRWGKTGIFSFVEGKRVKFIDGAFEELSLNITGGKKSFFIFLFVRKLGLGPLEVWARETDFEFIRG